MVGFGVSIFLITIGAIFKWAIKAKLNGIDLPALGVILMVVGAVSFILSLILTNRQPKRTSVELSGDERGGGAPPPV